jgi:hypothetical protein
VRVNAVLRSGCFRSGPDDDDDDDDDHYPHDDDPHHDSTCYGQSN